MSKESIASSQNVLPPPDTYLDNYEQNRMSKPHLLIDPSCKISDELVYAAVGTPMGPPGCENYSYQQHISTFGTMLPRNQKYIIRCTIKFTLKLWNLLWNDWNLYFIEQKILKIYILMQRSCCQTSAVKVKVIHFKTMLPPKMQEIWAASKIIPKRLCIKYCVVVINLVTWEQLQILIC